MKIIRRTWIKISTREIIVVRKNETPAVCPFCSSPIPPEISAPKKAAIDSQSETATEPPPVGADETAKRER